MTRGLLVLALYGGCFSAGIAAETYTYPQLVERMTDLTALAALPPAGEKTSLASSYDRKSRYDAATDRYLNWDANGDGGGFIRREGQGYVLMDVQGPGCIWRTWSARPESGHVKIFLDGALAPAVDLPFTSYFDGQLAPFNRPNLVYLASAAANGLNNYTPIPFQKSCKIVADPGWGSYYQFTYTQFPKGTVVPTFSVHLSPEDSAALDRADKILGQCGSNPTTAARAETERGSITAETGRTALLADLDGPGAITALKIKLPLPTDPEAQRILLRQLTLSITWDDETTPAVWSPLGDFFGYVGGGDVFSSLPVGLLPDGTLYSYWYMPYGRKAHLEIANDGAAPLKIDWEISHAALDRPIASLARFHAKWHRDSFPTDRLDRAPDWTLLTTQGSGRYVGTHLHVWNPRGSWWGEGDDKFFVDGEKFPSTFGTGSEDYFGYAWSSSGHFSRAYHNQILNEHNSGHADDNRWHIPDSVPFESSFEGDIEKYFPNARSTLYAAEVFWYLNAGGTDPYRPVPVADRFGYWTRPTVYQAAGVIEGESLRPDPKPAHHARPQDTYQYGTQWSGDKQLLWEADHTGEVLVSPLPAQSAGRYRLTAHFTSAPNYGIFQLALDGANVGPSVDLYSERIRPTDLVDLGLVTLPGGKPSLTVTVTGKDAASTGYFFGLDYLKLTPVPAQ